MPTMRVYELAKEMDMNSKALLDTMIEMGLPMKNHMSTIPGNEVNRIRAMVMKYLGHPDAEPIPRPPEKKEAPPLAGLRKSPAQRAQAMEQSQTMNRGGSQQGLRPGLSQGYQGQSRPGQSVPGQSRPGQSVPTQSRPGQSVPGQSRPGQGIAGQGVAGQSRPGQSITGQSRPGQSVPAQGRPGQGIAGQSRPGQGVPVQSRPGQGFTTQGQPGQSAAGQNRPGQSIPAQGRPGQGIRPQGAGPASSGPDRGFRSGLSAQTDAARGARDLSPRRQAGEAINPEDAKAIALARQRRLQAEAAGATGAEEAKGSATAEARPQARELTREQEQARALTPEQAQAQAQAQSQTPEQTQTQAPVRRRQPGESISPEEARAWARARRQPGDSISPEEARARAKALRQQDGAEAGAPGPEERDESQPRDIAPGAQEVSAATQEQTAPGADTPKAEAAQATAATAAATGKADTQRQTQTQAQARPSGPRAGAGAGRPVVAGQGPGQSRTQSFADKFARAPGQGQAKAPKPKRAQPGADNRTKGFNKGPKAPVIGRDTADQLSHLGSATEEDSRLLNKVENAVGDKAYDRGGITRTPSRKQNRYDEARPANRPRVRGGKDRGRPVRQEPAPVVIKTITLDGPTTVMEFARLLGKKTTDIIKRLITYGIMANVNFELDLDTLTLLGQDFGTQVEARVTKEDRLVATDGPDSSTDLIQRPPVVTIMGHVDHGKTSLLDSIRNANVTASEAGGITQHIGAYRVEINNREITFLDTPGHEAFTAMRARGAQCTDIAVLVVAADDGVMPQTIEAINHAKAAKVPIIVAINKIDLEAANPERVKQELTEYGLLAEEWGGDTIFAEVSAKTEQGIDTLLEMILLVADMGDLKANPNRKAKGVVIEAKLDRGRGAVATVLVQNGTLESGDFLIAGSVQGRVRVMYDERGNLVKRAGPSMPVEVVGLSEVPMAGDTFQVVEDERLAKQIASERTAVRREEVIHSRSRISLEDLFAQIQTKEIKDLNLIIKADVQGSIEALKTSLEKLSNDEVRVVIIHQAVGGITEADVDFAIASNAIIIGFNVRPDSNAKKVAEANQVDIRLYRVIYNAIEDVKSALSGLLKPEIRESVIGRAEVRQVIRVPRVGSIAGCYILEGKIARGCQLRVIRDNIVIHEGSLGSLRRFKDDVREVATGFECGIGIDRFQDFRDGDNIEGFILEEIKRELV